MDSDNHPERRQHDRRIDGVTAKVLRKVFVMRRGFGTATAKNLLPQSEYRADFIERVLAIPRERRTARRRSVVVVRASNQPENVPLADGGRLSSMGVAELAVLHRLRYETDCGVHEITFCDCPDSLKRFELVQLDENGIPSITLKGRRALQHHACVRALEDVRSRLHSIPLNEDIKFWLESNRFLRHNGTEYEVTDRGLSWLETNLAPCANQPISKTS